MDALAGAHDAAVQMIDTSVVRVHQHGSCIAGNKAQHMGRSRGGLTSKIHAVVDANGLPVRLGLTASSLAKGERLSTFQRCLKALIERPRVSIELRKSVGDLGLQSSDGALTHGTFKRTRIGRYGCPLADGVIDMTLKTVGVLANAEGLNGTHIRLGEDLGIGRDVGDLRPVPPSQAVRHQIEDDPLRPQAS
jgi:hypothetical protein